MTWVGVGVRVVAREGRISAETSWAGRGRPAAPAPPVNALRSPKSCLSASSSDRKRALVDGAHARQNGRAEGGMRQWGRRGHSLGAPVGAAAHRVVHRKVVQETVVTWVRQGRRSEWRPSELQNRTPRPRATCTPSFRASCPESRTARDRGGGVRLKARGNNAEPPEQSSAPSRGAAAASYGWPAHANERESEGPTRRSLHLQAAPSHRARLERQKVEKPQVHILVSVLVLASNLCPHSCRRRGCAGAARPALRAGSQRVAAAQLLRGQGGHDECVQGEAQMKRRER